ncbi:MAG: alpha/beta fold hydrolase [Herpetosiphon sp.]|nr:alpha/beta fold hydrolase [Herpetosiphon sp.]
MSRSPQLKKRRWFRWLIALLALLVVAYFGISAYVVSELTKTTRRSFVANPRADGLNVEDVAFRSARDDVTLKGWLLKAPDDQGRVIVMVHGHNAARDDDKNGMYPVAQNYIKNNFSVLMFDLRGCGESEGDRFSLGWYEQDDVRGAIRFVQQRGFTHIGVHGYSMGAASGLLAIANEPAVQAMVEDSGYARLLDVLDQEVPKRSGLPAIFTPGIVLMSNMMYGIKTDQVNPAQSAAAFARPLLVIHGDKDELIPPNNANRIWQARYGDGTPNPATFYIIPNAEHTQGYNVAKQEYLDKVTGFFAQQLR